MFWACPEVMLLEPIDVLIEDCLGKQKKERERLFVGAKQSVC